MSYLERRLRDLEVRRRADEISQQIEEQQKLEKEATKNEKDIDVESPPEKLKTDEDDDFPF